MHLILNLFTLLFTIVGLVFMVFAAPVDSPVLEGLKKRDVNTVSSCIWQSNDLYYRVYEITTAGLWDNDKGKGFLDNLNGQCDGLNVEFYNFAYDGSGMNGNGGAVFGIKSAAPGHCVENAVWLASQPTGAIWGLTCVEKAIS